MGNNVIYPDDEDEEEEEEFNSEISLDQLPEKLKRKLRREERRKKMMEGTKQQTNNLNKKRLLKMQDSLLYFTTRLISFLTLKPVHQLSLYKETDIVLETIDSTSRTVFPTAFLFTMLVYWTTYLYIMPDEILLDIPENALVEYHSG